MFKDKKYMLIMVDPDAGEAADVLHWMVTDIEVISTCCRIRPLDKHNLNEKKNEDTKRVIRVRISKKNRQNNS